MKLTCRHVHHWTFDKLICAISIICLAVVLVLVLVLKDSLRTYFKSLSWSWSLGVMSLSLSLGGQVQEVLVLVLVLGGQVLVNIPGPYTQCKLSSKSENFRSIGFDFKSSKFMRIFVTITPVVFFAHCICSLINFSPWRYYTVHCVFFTIKLNIKYIKIKT